jgi:AcrR family transcriptional regulator
MPPLSRKESQEATRVALREAAAREIARRGFAGTTIDSIAASAGFTRGAFYSNYATKLDLLLEVLEEIHSEELRTWQAMIESAESLEAMLDALAKRFDEYVERHIQVILAIELRLEARRNPDFATHYAVSAQRLFDHTLQMAERLTERAGSPKCDAQPIALAIRAIAIGLELDLEARGSGHLSPGSIMAMMLGRMLRPQTAPGSDGPTTFTHPA